MVETTIVSVMTYINFDFEDDWIFNSEYNYHLMIDASKFSHGSYDGYDVIITMDNTINPLEKEGSITFISQVIGIDDLGGDDKVEHASKIISTCQYLLMLLHYLSLLLIL